METKNKDILFIVHSYHSFQKDTIDLLAKNFKNVYVIVRYKPIAEISRLLPIKSLIIHRKEFIVQDESKPDNVHIFLAPLWYLPIKTFYKYLGQYHLMVVNSIIKNNNIRFDIVHAHFTWTSGYVAMKLKEKYQTPYVLTIHSSNRFESQLSSGNEKFYSIWRQASAIIRVNKNHIKELKEFNKETYYIPNGFNQGIFYPRNQMDSRKKLGLEKDKKILLSIGHLDKVKGHTYLIEAIASLKEEYHKEFQLIIIGEGKLRHELEQQISKLGLEKVVRLVGSMPHKDIPLWINSSDIFVMPSLNEGMPISMLEALSCGLYFIGTRVGGIPEVIVSEEYGILVDSKDSNALAQALKKALEKKPNKEKIINYSKKFSWKIIVKRFLEIYKNILDKENV